MAYLQFLRSELWISTARNRRVCLVRVFQAARTTVARVMLCVKCHITAFLGLQCAPTTCLTLPTSLLGDSKSRSLQIPLGHQFLMNECPGPGMCQYSYGYFALLETVWLACLIANILWTAHPCPPCWPSDTNARTRRLHSHLSSSP